MRTPSIPALTMCASLLAAKVGFATPPLVGANRDAPGLEQAPPMTALMWRQWRAVPPTPPALGDVTSRDDTPAVLTLREAVHAALENNPGIAAERLSPFGTAARIRQEQGLLDPTASITLGTNRRIEPSASALFVVGSLETRNYDWDLSLSKTLRLTGAEFKIDWTNNRLSTNATFAGLSPQYTPELLISLRQPLLQGFGRDFTYLRVRIAEAGTAQAVAEYRSRLAQFVEQVIATYWNLVQARENLAVQRDGLRLARELVRDNQARVRVGLLPPIAVKQAEAEAAGREEAVIVSENAVAVAEQTLRQTLQLSPAATFHPRPIEPAERPQAQPVEVDAEGILKSALEHRPEVTAARLAVRGTELTQRLRENALLPRLDVVGSYGLNGLSGEAVPQISFGDEGTEVVRSQFTGPYSKALDRMISGEFFSYSAGITVEIPIFNAAAEGAYTQSRIDHQRARLGLRQLLSDVTLEVERSVSDVRANWKRVQVTRMARELAEENLEHQHKRYEVGMATTKDLLDFQEDVTGARAAEVKAQIDYALSLARLRRVEGTLLERYDIVIEAPRITRAPWWARF